MLYAAIVTCLLLLAETVVQFILIDHIDAAVLVVPTQLGMWVVANLRVASPDVCHTEAVKPSDVLLLQATVHHGTNHYQRLVARRPLVATNLSYHLVQRYLARCLVPCML